MYFQELFIWLAREHQLSQLIDAPGGSCWLLGALWARMVPPGGSWQKFMKTIVLFSKTYVFHFPGLLLTSPMSCILDPLFCSLLDPRAENHQIKHPGTGFVGFWSPGQKITKSSLLGLVFSLSGAKPRMSSNRASWDWFCRLLEPRLESHRIKTSGVDFLDFCGQGQKGIKSGLLKLLFSTSGTNARESLNRDF